MAKVMVEGDPTALEMISAALRSAGLSTVEVELAPRLRDVTRFPAAPGSWAAFADIAPELAYADWRNEVLSLVDAADTGPVRLAPARPESVVTVLRQVV